MTKRVLGAERVMRKISQLSPSLKAELDKGTERSAKDLVRTAKILIPVGGDVHSDGHERDKINATPVGDGGQLVDFGPKSKVIEGERGPRPFVNPAVSVTRKRFKNRAKRDASKVAKRLFNG